MATENLDSPLRVLVADGYRDAADILALLIGSWGHDARVAYTGPGAADEASAYRPDVVVADLCLPELDGLQLAHRLRGQATLIALTGLGQTTFRHRAWEAGFDYFLPKPAEPDELREVLEGAKAGRRVPQAGPAHGGGPPDSR